jgi:hypothetical protein
MTQFTHYFGRFQNLRGQVTGLPSWARSIVLIAALPGLILLCLSILVFIASLLALLLLAAPVYVGLKRAIGGVSAVPVAQTYTSPGTKHVDVTVVNES